VFEVPHGVTNPTGATSDGDVQWWTVMKLYVHAQCAEARAIRLALQTFTSGVICKWLYDNGL
jgi:hypothetical protein